MQSSRTVKSFNSAAIKVGDFTSTIILAPSISANSSHVQFQHNIYSYYKMWNIFDVPTPTRFTGEGQIWPSKPTECYSIPNFTSDCASRRLRRSRKFRYAFRNIWGPLTPARSVVHDPWEGDLACHSEPACQGIRWSLHCVGLALAGRKTCKFDHIFNFIGSNKNYKNPSSTIKIWRASMNLWYARPHQFSSWSVIASRL